MKKSLILNLIAFIVIIPITKNTAQSINEVWSFSSDSTSIFSSPKAIDLNNDEIKDIILGVGMENQFTNYGAIAIDGQTGDLLWQIASANQIYTTPIFQDINQDHIPDVFIGGRDAIFYAIDGQTGDLIWRFWNKANQTPSSQGWYNFYNPKWLPDLNMDGIKEILISNGGDATALPAEENRPSGHLMILDGATGEIIAADEMPDQKETYCSPLLFFTTNGLPHILFGSGGETVGGKLFLTTLTDLLANDISNAQVLLADTCKGFIATPSLVDITQDNQLDIIVPAFNEKLVAINGQSFEVIWENKLEGYENYSSPTIGNFTTDKIPDVFYIASKGNWPFYFGCKMMMLNGQTGDIIWELDNDIQQLSSPNAFDWDNDGIDEVFLLNNFDADTTNTGIELSSEWGIISAYEPEMLKPYSKSTGINIFSVPLISDLDNNNRLDLISIKNNNITHWLKENGFAVYREEFDFNRTNISWSGYFGTFNDGTYPFNLDKDEDKNDKQITIIPNPVQDVIYFKHNRSITLEELIIYDVMGRMVYNLQQPVFADLSFLPSGTYFYKIKHSLGSESGKFVRID